MPYYNVSTPSNDFTVEADNREQALEIAKEHGLTGDAGTDIWELLDPDVLNELENETVYRKK